LLKIRLAEQYDRNDVLKFCFNTFEWGDYIDQVWDIWFSDPNGRLLIAEHEIEKYTKRDSDVRKSSIVIAVSHVYLCPNKKMIWLEGIRIRSDYRRKYVATELIRKMIEYGAEQGAEEAAAIVSTNNVASQILMQRNGFVKISQWNYFSGYIIQNGLSTYDYKVKRATLGDVNNIAKYLRYSKIFKLSGESYVDRWRWYPIDLDSGTLHHLITNNIVLAAENESSTITGVVIANKDNIGQIQIVYLDTNHVSVLKQLVIHAINLEQSTEKYGRMQIFSPQVPYIDSVMKNIGLNECGEFLLYKRKI
jgi:acetyltransferase (GNAT) family protein